jgi:predicted dehydrogenase
MRVGILGAGGMGNVHATQYRKMPDVELRFFDVDAEKSKAFQAKWGASMAGSADELIRSVDVVDVCLPTDLHLDLGLRAIAEGRAVFMEKPMARTLEQCSRLVEASSKARVPFMPGQVVRFFPEFRRAKEIVASGGIGTPAAARTRRGGAAPKGADGWFMDHKRSGGVLFDLAIHDFDWLRWTLGEVKTVYARSLAALRDGGPDYALTTLKFECGALGHVEATWMDPSGFRVTFEVCGSGGMIEHDSRNAATVRTHLAAGSGGSGDPREAATRPRSGPEAPLFPTEDPYYRELRAFLDAVSVKSPPPVSALDGWMAVSIAQAAIDSSTRGAPAEPSRLP